jgi:N-acetylmuramoyl-L-alanine amidase
MTNRRQRATLSIVALSLTLCAGSRCPAGAEEAATAATKPDAAKCDKTQFRVVVDVGHTAEAYGATSARNAREYDFNFELAWEIEQGLKEDGFTRTVLLVTGGPAHPSLEDRVAAANRLSPNLFLSIHHDSVPDKFLENWDYEDTPSHFSDRFSGHSLFVSNANRDFKASVQFGQILGMQLKDRGLQYARHYTESFMGHRRRQLVDAIAGVYRYDQLIVLRRTQMPAVLLEAGSIINRDEEVAMSLPERRALISAAVTSAVEMFCDARAVRPEPVHTARPEPVHRAWPEPVRTVHSEPERAAVTPVAAKTTARPTGASWLMNLFTRQSSTNARK